MNQEQLDQQPNIDYRLIPLTRGQSAKVSPEDYEWLNQWKWSARWDPSNQSFYATRNIVLMSRKEARDTGAKRTKTTPMHRVIMGAVGGIVDHISGDTLDNRRSNLRMVTASQNAINRKQNLTYRSSKYKGVSFHKITGKWQAHISANKKHMYLGLFDTQEEAYLVYCTASKNLHGEFARA